MLVVNFFGSPGSGKSTGAAYLFSRLKLNGVNAELVTEFPKDKVWEESKEAFNNQAYLFGNQYFRISRLKDKVDVVVTDSPLLLSIFYNNTKELGENFNNMVNDVFKSYNSVNVFIKRAKGFNPIGRFQKKEESDKLSQDMVGFLEKYGVEYETYDGNKKGYDAIFYDIMKKLRRD